MITNEAKITKQDIIDSIMHRLREIDKEIELAQLDYKASKLSGGLYCDSAAYWMGIVNSLNKEQITLQEIKVGFYGK